MKLEASKSIVLYPSKENFKKLAAVGAVAAVFSGCGASMDIPVKKAENNKTLPTEQNITQEDIYPEATGGILPLPSEQKE